MRATAIGAAGLAGLVLWMLAVVPPAPRVPHVPVPRAAGAAAPFPPPRAAVAVRAASAPRRPDGEIARLGRAAPRQHPLRQAFEDATDLAGFALERLPAAAAGDGASQYLIYLSLDQCRSFLHGDFDGANANLARMSEVSDLNAEELAAWQAELERCRGFAARDWSAVGSALGDERPGGEVEYASVWFERAVRAGHPAALAEAALQPAPYGVSEREALLAQALAAGGPEVYWLLFAHSAEVQDGAITAPALAWLIAACRAGQDCREDAAWFRGFVCAGNPARCPAGQSALEYYWYAATPRERAEASLQANEIEEFLMDGRWQDTPIPPLENRDLRRLWAEVPREIMTP